MRVMTALRRKSTKQIFRVFQEADGMLADGSDVATVCRMAGLPRVQLRPMR